MNRQCTKCGLIKPIDNFYIKTQAKDGIDSWCKQCYSELRKQATRERILNNPSVISRAGFSSPHFSPTSINQMKNNAYKRANKRNLDFDLPMDKLAELVHNFCETHIYSWQPNHPFKPSIDKIDNTKGYILDNIQILWNIENKCKNLYTNDDVILFCKEKLKQL